MSNATYTVRVVFADTRFAPIVHRGLWLWQANNMAIGYLEQRVSGILVSMSRD